MLKKKNRNKQLTRMVTNPLTDVLITGVVWFILVLFSLFAQT